MSSSVSAESYLGAQIRIATTFGEEIEGELFCCDIQGSNSSNSVIICQRLSNGTLNYKWLKANIVKEVTALRHPSSTVEELPHIDLRQIEARAKRDEEQAAGEARRYGVGVTEHAQEVFDALSKTYDPQWEGEDIKVLGVRIIKPYDPLKNISGGKEETQERVRKVLQGELGKRGKRPTGQGR
mmetsp:Transcript_59168/g.157477  ORF Transcript_59168/g.157477 Transcript_59168/m.157477 type:complete len:183 (-) Transcript_59168:104-652(-)|eukprot:CAMPEP_0194502930 /NCGR_PEP_ID=MMETSP0253-20130528/27670_1 /TAXON_ID=2966 /ORGANISM="Noctiluca scintillans" /LENGTH=182 /DNA_ID=CAMNT_0039345155 /DNA_START=62 /DNA_END=610 /DNA_ORIENTATION=+